MNGKLSLFGSVFALIFVAELPDKTSFATLLLATQNKPLPVFIGVAFAFLVQTAVAIFAGDLFGLLPQSIVHRASGALFLVFAFMALSRKSEGEEKQEPIQKGFWKTLFSAFFILFIAEWGDLSQLATAVMEARYHEPLILFSAATLALWSVTGVAVVMGNVLKKHLPIELLNRVAAAIMCGVGLLLIFDIV